MSYPNYSWTIATHRLGKEMLQENAARAEAQSLAQRIVDALFHSDAVSDTQDESIDGRANRWKREVVQVLLRPDAKDAIPPGPEGVTAKCVIGEYCSRHQFIHGAEAEELRQRIEKLMRVDTETQHHALQDVLDEVDARDSLAFVEVRQKWEADASPKEPRA
jgi:hypothetical protein